MADGPDFQVSQPRWGKPVTRAYLLAMLGQMLDQPERYLGKHGSEAWMIPFETGEQAERVLQALLPVVNAADPNARDEIQGAVSFETVHGMHALHAHFKKAGLRPSSYRPYDDDSLQYGVVVLGIPHDAPSALACLRNLHTRVAAMAQGQDTETQR